MKTVFTFLLFLFSIFGFGQQPAVPKGYTVLDEKNGDLDKDGVPEKAIVYTTTDSTADGRVREIRILKKKGNAWTVWKTSRNAVHKSEEGGMMGDPFQEIRIENGVLAISESGGSSWKWSHTDKYRFQNNAFELIGYSSIAGKPCEYWAEIDFNLSTGKLVYTKKVDECADDGIERDETYRKNESETFYKKDLRLNLENRNLQDIKIISPVHKYELYL